MSTKETIITINDQYDIDIEGGLTEIASNNKKFQTNREKMKELSKKLSSMDKRNNSAK